MNPKEANSEVVAAKRSTGFSSVKTHEIKNSDSEIQNFLYHYADAVAQVEYEKLGACICKMMQSNVIELRLNHCMVNISWGLFNSSDEVLVEFEILYCLKRIDNKWKIIFVVDHNEEANVKAYLAFS